MITCDLCGVSWPFAEPRESMIERGWMFFPTRVKPRLIEATFCSDCRLSVQTAVLDRLGIGLRQIAWLQRFPFPGDAA